MNGLSDLSSLAELVRWLRPQFLGAILPWLLALLWLRRRATAAGSARRRPDLAEGSPWAKVIDADLLPHLLADPTRPPAMATEHRPEAPRRSDALALISWAVLGSLLLLALAGPQLKLPGAAPLPALRPAAARVLLIDLSPAFAALPAATQQSLRSKLRRFVRALPAGETALVAVAGDAWLVVPPTEDAAVLDGFLSELSADAAPLPGDQPERGLALARQTVAATGARRQDVYWLRIDAPAGRDDGSAGQSGVAPKILQAGASVEDWLALATPPAAAGWQASLLNLAPRPDAGWHDLGPWLILLGLPFAAWLSIGRAPRGGENASDGRGRGGSGRGETVAAPGQRPGHLAGVAALFGVLSLGGLHGGPANAADPAFDQGVAHYRAGRYAEAAAAFAAAAPTDPRAHYNRGNALARSGRLPAALDAYDQSLRLSPGNPQTLHNREIVARLLKPPPPPPPPPGAPPPGAPPPGAPPPPAEQSAEAARAAEQWLRKPPASVDGLLKRKLALEEARRKQRAAP